MRPTTILLVAAIALGLLCCVCNAQWGSNGGYGAYYAPQSYGSNGGFGGGSVGGMGSVGGYGSQGASYGYARYAAPIEYNYVPYQQNGFGYGSYYGNRAVFVYYAR